jgi:hypothetical protein
MILLSICLCQLNENFAAALRLSSASGFGLTIFISTFMKWDFLDLVAKLIPINSSGITGEINYSIVMYITITWLSGSIETFLVYSALSGNWKLGRFRYFGIKETKIPVETHRYNSVQRTFSYPDTLVFNYFDPDALPPILQAHAEVIFTTVQSLALVMGFQIDNSRNQAEHLLMILCNECRFGEHILTEPPARLHRNMFMNYRKWCEHLRIQPAFTKKSPGKAFQSQIEDILT